MFPGPGLLNKGPRAGKHAANEYRALAAPIGVVVRLDYGAGTGPYADAFKDPNRFQSMLDETAPAGWRYYDRLHYLPEVSDEYIDALPDWQQAICQMVRDLVHAADPDVAETIKRTVQPYFVLDGNICALLATKDHVNVFLYDGGIVPDPERIVTHGHGNETGRQIAIREGDPINRPALLAYFRQIIANNRAGGWRKLKAARPQG